MSKNHLDIVKTYYSAMANKDVEAMSQYLHPDARLLTPLAEVRGKDNILEAARGFTKAFTKLAVRRAFADGDQVMVAMDLDCVEPIGYFRTAGLLTLKEELIIDIELFYDGRPMEQLMKQAFADAHS